MNLDSIRAFCLSLPHATENVQWEDQLCFKVAGKIFVMIGLASVPQRVIFKCDPETFAELTERGGIEPAPYLGRYKWVMLESMDVVDSSEFEGLIRHSYAMVCAKIGSKLKKQRKPNPKPRRKALKA